MSDLIGESRLDRIAAIICAALYRIVTQDITGLDHSAPHDTDSKPFVFGTGYPRGNRSARWSTKNFRAYHPELADRKHLENSKMRSSKVWNDIETACKSPTGRKKKSFIRGAGMSKA